jgi:DNA mismatch endonuclease (patch repair protein)
VRKALSAKGLRYTTFNRDLPGSPDLANRSRKWAVFVHGCYWHRHPGCSKASTPKTNVIFWMSKFERNQERDAQAVEQLKELGYRVVLVWECETKQEASLRAKLGTLA